MSKGYTAINGRLRHRLLVQKSVPVKDSIGANNTTYEDVQVNGSPLIVWGSIVTKTGREETISFQEAPKATHTIRTRYIPGLGETHRFLWEGRIFNIDFINNIDYRNKMYEIAATEDRGQRGDNLANSEITL